jgi:hypothetical protein
MREIFSRLLWQINYYMPQHPKILQQIKDNLIMLQNDYSKSKISDNEVYYLVLATINKVMPLYIEKKKGHFPSPLWAFLVVDLYHDGPISGILDFPYKRQLLQNAHNFVTKKINKHISVGSVGYVEYFLRNFETFGYVKVEITNLDKDKKEVVINTIEPINISPVIIEKNIQILCHITNHEIISHKDAVVDSMKISIRGDLYGWVSLEWEEKKLSPKAVATFQRLQDIKNLNKIPLSIMSLIETQRH